MFGYWLGFGESKKDKKKNELKRLYEQQTELSLLVTVLSLRLGINHHARLQDIDIMILDDLISVMVSLGLYSVDIGYNKRILLVDGQLQLE